MNCPYCKRKISFAKICPHCGNKISYGGNTEIYEKAQHNTLTFKEIFADTFKKHSQSDLVASLLRQPNGGVEMLANWRRPWMFFRVFAFLLALSVVLNVLKSTQYFAESMYIIFGCMVVPLTVMTFIWEMDVHSNVSIFDMITLLFFGGIAALLPSAELNGALDISAAFTEEPVKLAICVLFMIISKRKFYALDGLAIGAAVGAGFAFMESIAYVYMNNNINLVIMRGILAISSHILYTAPAIGALALVMNGRRFKADYLTNKRFLCVLASGMFWHFMNNSGITLITFINTPTVRINLMFILKTICSWAVLLYILRAGIRQALGTHQTAVLSHMAPNDQIAMRELYGLRGQYANRTIRLKRPVQLLMGRGSSCQIPFTSPTVSTTHCQIMLVENGVEVCDLQSRNGTYINGKLIKPREAVILHPGDSIGLDKNRELFIVH